MTIRAKDRIEKLNRMKDFGSDRSRFVRLDKNERTSAFGKQIVAEVLASITPELLPMYPDQTVLYSKLATFLGVSKDMLLLTHGSDAAIKALYETYIEAGDEVIFPDPTYAMVDVYAQMFGAKAVKIHYSNVLEFEFDKLLAAISEKTRMVVIANPNQPTGTVLAPVQVQRLLSKTKATNTVLVVDEAYQPFSNVPSCAKYLADNPQLAIVQTFSKAIGLASIRLGYIVSHPENINQLYKVKTLSDINILALKFGEYIIDHYSEVEEYVDSIKKAKSWLEKELTKLDFEFINSETNFVHFRFPSGVSLQDMEARLKKEGFLVRIGGGYLAKDGSASLPATLDGCMRITMGPIDQMQQFVAALKKVLSSVK